MDGSHRNSEARLPTVPSQAQPSVNDQAAQDEDMTMEYDSPPQSHRPSNDPPSQSHRPNRPPRTPQQGPRRENTIPTSSRKGKEREYATTGENNSGDISDETRDSGGAPEPRWEGPTTDITMLSQCLLAMNKVHAGITQIAARMDKMEAEQEKVASKINSHMFPPSSRGGPRSSKRYARNSKQDGTDADIDMDSDDEEDEEEAAAAAAKARRQGPAWCQLQVRRLYNMQ
jgi:hypothetical protein